MKKNDGKRKILITFPSPSLFPQHFSVFCVLVMISSPIAILHSYFLYGVAVRHDKAVELNMEETSEDERLVV